MDQGMKRAAIELATSGNPFVFVVGCPRSGTTLLQRMLNNHPKLAVAYDTLFIPPVLRREKAANPDLTDAEAMMSAAQDSVELVLEQL